MVKVKCKTVRERIFGIRRRGGFVGKKASDSFLKFDSHCAPKIGHGKQLLNFKAKYVINNLLF